MDTDDWVLVEHPNEEYVIVVLEPVMTIVFL